MNAASWNRWKREPGNAGRWYRAAEPLRVGDFATVDQDVAQRERLHSASRGIVACLDGGIVFVLFCGRVKAEVAEYPDLEGVYRIVRVFPVAPDPGAFCAIVPTQSAVEGFTPPTPWTPESDDEGDAPV